MTNGDKIRQMSNEELAKMIAGNCQWCKCYVGMESCEDVDCEDGVKAYLDMEVE